MICGELIITFPPTAEKPEVDIQIKRRSISGVCSAARSADFVLYNGASTIHTTRRASYPFIEAPLYATHRL